LLSSRDIPARPRGDCRSGRDSCDRQQALPTANKEGEATS
jgi:hypothetical protein